METWGFLACALIGLSLGLTGAGGSILTVPVLVYLFAAPPLLATSYSLFVVGSTSLLAAANKARRGEVLAGPALAFGLVSMGVVMAVRYYAVPHLPKSGYNEVSLMLFAILMILAAFSMIRRKQTTINAGQVSLYRSLPYALLAGLVTGFLGAGGGFLLIPVLTQLLGLDMKKAAGTSLAVIALNSLAGFALDLTHVAIQWRFLLSITLIAGAGGMAGVALCGRINSQKLKVSFGWLILALGLIILSSEWLKICKLL